MKGDFTRDTFDPAKHFSRVLMQQGRVTLDADANEQASILLHYLRTLAYDLIGPYAAPIANAGFQIGYDATNKDLTIGAGRYYVDGILVENDLLCLYSQQPDFPLLDSDPLSLEIQKPSNTAFWIYLDVWERHITCLEDDDIREKALNGPDTCTRSKVVWQVKGVSQNAMPPVNNGAVAPGDCANPLGNLVAVSQAKLAARIDPGLKTESACITPPDSKYRGAENQLYRVEIHVGGPAGVATFKWARDNASVATAWLGVSGNGLQVGRTRGFVAGNWVELSDDIQELQGLPGTLVNLTTVEGNTLSAAPNSIPVVTLSQLLNPKVRRWDQAGNVVVQVNQGVGQGTVPLQENVWIDLEDGVQIQFSPGGQYLTGDYWLIPARVATGNVEWPPSTDPSGQPLKDADGNIIPAMLPPDGIEHHYAPLGFVSLLNNAATLASCGCMFRPGTSCFGTRLARPKNIDARFVAEEAVEESKEVAVIKKRVRKSTP